MTEDQVRDELREKTGIKVGQLTTFNMLGFTERDINTLDPDVLKNHDVKKALSLKPDGWYCPDDGDFAIVAETKSSDKPIEEADKQIEIYMHIVNTKYSKVVGIQYNHDETKTYKMVNGEIVLLPKLKTLQNIQAYNDIFLDNKIDKKLIYSKTRKINELLHFNFKIKNLIHRMIWTACILVAKRYGCVFSSDQSLEIIKQSTIDVLKRKIEQQSDYKKNHKISELWEHLNYIKLNDSVVKEEDKQEFLDAVSDIAENINSNEWNGEDVMAIFFNEFTRYKSDIDEGQVFTPYHITSFMYDLANVSANDHVLDACCGSGSFLTKAMSNMIKEVGGNNTKEAKSIKESQIYGIELDPDLFALACANMLLHKDGKSNIRNLDATSETAGNFIQDSKISKVLMNPPYEDEFKPMEIVKNVLNNVEKGADCLFLLPNNKLEKHRKKTLKLLEEHTLKNIIKLPTDLFAGLAGSGEVSIFWFKAHEPQNNKEIVCFNIENDGLETVKNQGRHDVNNLWSDKYEPYWIKAINTSQDDEYNTKKIITLKDPLTYQLDYDFQVNKSDFVKTIIDRVMFENPEIASLFNLKGSK